MMFTLQVDDAIYLRMLSARDAEAMFMLIENSREYLRTWLPWIDATKQVEDSLEFIKHTFYAYNNRAGVTAGIFYHGEFVGVIAFNRLDFTNRIGVIGYWLGEDFQKRGIMTKTVAAFTTYGFDELDLNRIEIRVATENKASIAIPEKLKFLKEGTLRQVENLNDTYVDHELFSMLKEEWKRK